MKRWNKKRIEDAVQKSTSVAGVLRLIGLPSNSGNYKTFYRYKNIWGLDTSHFKPYKSNCHVLTIPLEKIIVKNCVHSQNALRNAILRNGLIEYKCSECDNEGRWRGKDLSLHLDHINGESNDNRLENLRFLCPNCHQQTETFGSKNIKVSASCADCGIKILKNSTRCVACSNKLKRNRRTKISWPSIEKLINMVSQSSFREVGRQLGVSDNAIRKHIANNQ